MLPLRRPDLRKFGVPISAIFLALLGTWYLSALAWSRSPKMDSFGPTTFHFEAVKGFFAQDEPSTVASNYDYTKHNFGLLDREYETDATVDDAEKPGWARFHDYLAHLVKTSPAGITYKLFYLGRHGQGFHNVAEDFYGTEAWDEYWAKLEGNGSITWADAHLTAVGESQALAAHAFFGEQLAWASMPAPQRYYVSPLYRCLQTASLTFTGLQLPEERPFAPTIKERAREVLGVHTCDRRSTRTAIHAAFPLYALEPGFAEHDELWRADHRETQPERDVRARALFEDLFAHLGDDDASVYVSLTSHSGQIASMLRVLGHREFPLPTGGLIPVLVKATRLPSKADGRN